MARWDRRSSYGSWDVFFKIVFGQNLGVAVLQNIVQLRDDANNLFAIEFGANPNDQTRDTIHGRPREKVMINLIKIGGENTRGKKILIPQEFNLKSR